MFPLLQILQEEGCKIELTYKHESSPIDGKNWHVPPFRQYVSIGQFFCAITPSTLLGTEIVEVKDHFSKRNGYSNKT